jgi:hypothetical protein
MAFVKAPFLSSSTGCRPRSRPRRVGIDDDDAPPVGEALLEKPERAWDSGHGDH